MKKNDDIRKSRQSAHIDLISDEFDANVLGRVKQETGVELGVIYKVEKHQPDSQDGRYYLKKALKDKKGEEILQVSVKFDAAGKPAWQNLPTAFQEEMLKKSVSDQKDRPIIVLQTIAASLQGFGDVRGELEMPSENEHMEKIRETI